MKKQLFFFIGFIVLLVEIKAQINFEQIPAPNSSDFNGVQQGSIAFADVDGDSDQDALITGSNGTVNLTELYTNDGSGGYTLVSGTPFGGVALSSVAFADIDGDSDQDILITGHDGSYPTAKLYTNDGSGGYTLISGTPFDGVIYSSVAFADVDGDSDQDILITGYNGSTVIAKLYTNDGSGVYTLVSGTPFEGVYYGTINFADIDGDGDQDVLITGNNGSTVTAKLYTNDGSGGYTLISGTPFVGVYYSSVAFADIDGDTDLDVLITGGDLGGTFYTNLYTNDGSGVYTLVSGTPFDDVAGGSIAFADVDADGDQDVLITGIIAIEGIAKLYTNDGSGGYTLVTGTPFDGVFYSFVAFSDVDGDGDQDVLITGSGGSGVIAKLYRNISTPACAIAQQTISSFNTSLCQGDSITAVLAASETGVKYAIYNPADNRVSDFVSGDGNTLTIYSKDTIKVSGDYYIQAEDESDNTCAKLIGSVKVVSINALPVVDLGTDISICSGSPIVLNSNATGAATLQYSWTNSTSTTASINVQPTVTTTYEVTVTDGNLCENTDEIEIIVNAAPKAYAEGNTPLCTNEDLNLSASGGVGYRWYTPSGVYFSNLKKPTVAANSVVNGVYKVVVSNVGACKDSALVAVVVKPLVTGANTTEVTCGLYTWPVNGETYMTSGQYFATSSAAGNCVTDTLNLTIKPQYKDTVLVSACGTFVSGQGNTYSSSGIYTETYGTTSGCDSLVTYKITFGIVAGTTIENVCNSYTWPLNGMTYTETGIYTHAMGSVGTACDSVYALDLTITKATESIVNQSGSVLTSVNTGIAYFWMDCESATEMPGERNQVFTANKNGSYALRLVSANGCISTSGCVTVSTVGITENTNALTFDVYPNPSTGIVHVQLSAAQSATPIRITDLAGKLLQEIAVSSGDEIIDLSTYAQGVYFISLETENAQSISKRIIKL